MPQIPSYDPKTVLADDDLIVIADSVDSNINKRVKASTIWKTNLITEKTPGSGISVTTVGGSALFGGGSANLHFDDTFETATFTAANGITINGDVAFTGISDIGGAPVGSDTLANIIAAGNWVVIDGLLCPP